MTLEELTSYIAKDRAIRRNVTQASHFWFFNIFLFPRIHNRHPMALFHREMFALTESKHKLVAVMAFRESGKSTIMNTSYALWSVLGEPQKKFVIIVSKTQNQAKAHFMSIRRELETNALLAADLGPFESDETMFGMYSLSLKRLDAKIMAVCRDQGIRGLRHGTHRPDLIILDDIEDSVSVQEESNRNQAHEWFANEVLPAGSSGTKIVVLGNMLHEDSLLMRLRRKIIEKKMEGVFRGYPFEDDDGRILWPEKFSNKLAIEAVRNLVPDGVVWAREYLLQMKSGCRAVYIEGPKDWPGDDQDRLNFEKTVRKHKSERWDPEEYPARRLGKYKISAPIIIPENTIYMPIPYGEGTWRRGRTGY